MNAPHTEVYQHEMPGGQYSNLTATSESSWSWGQWDEVKDNVSPE